MRSATLEKPSTNPEQLLAIIDLRARGWTDREIKRVLNIKRSTWFVRLAELRAIEAAGPPGADDD